MRPRLGMLLFLALLVSVGLWAQNDPLIGTWKMNVAKSKYSPGPAPKSGTTKISAVPGGIRLVTNGVNDKGKATLAVVHRKVRWQGLSQESHAWREAQSQSKGGCHRVEED